MLGLRTKIYQEHDRDVQQEGAKTVQEEGEEANVVNLVHGDLGNLPDKSDSQVHDSADGGEVVDGYQRVHLVVGGAEQALDHGETQGLEDDTSNLVDDTNPDELDLSDRGNDDTNDNDGDVEEDLQVGLGNTKSPSGQQHGDGGGGLDFSLAVALWLSAAGNRTLSIWMKATERYR